MVSASNNGIVQVREVQSIENMDQAGDVVIGRKLKTSALSGDGRRVLLLTEEACLSCEKLWMDIRLATSTHPEIFHVLH